MTKTIRIATRKSKLALWQAEYVQLLLQKQLPNYQIDLVKMTSRGDEILDRPLADVGGKALFVKSLEQAILAGKADIAVHSMKDVPAVLPEGFTIAAICERASPNDALVAKNNMKFADLPIAAKVGTSSYRRASQLLANRPDLKIEPIRGNVQTRLDKLNTTNLSAIILAEAGLQRLELESCITEVFNTAFCVPGAGQGAVGIECLASNTGLINILQKLNCQRSSICVTAERAMNAYLNGNCHSPIGSYATLVGNELNLSGFIGNLETGKTWSYQACMDKSQPLELGTLVAKELLAQGAVL